MSNDSVFSGMKKPNPLDVKLPNINSEEFDKVINTRRSVRVFSDDKIPEKMTGRKFEKLIARILRKNGCIVTEQVNIWVGNVTIQFVNEDVLAET